MNKTDRIYLLDQILKSARYPVSKQTLMERLDCSQATLYRIVADLRDAYAAPLESGDKGFYYRKDEHFELPGLRLTAAEIQALLMIVNLLEDLETDLLRQPLQRLLDATGEVLQQHGIHPARHIRIIKALPRHPDRAVFAHILGALQAAQRIEIEYRAPQGERSHRVLSPQQLTHYKNTWYLDAWCHLREGIRSFALEQIQRVTPQQENAVKLDPEAMKQHFSGSYGIFSGAPQHTAEVRFDVHKAPWAVREQWHSKQQLTALDEQHVLIRIPYSQDHELLMDILRYGDAATVMAPPELREKIAATLRKAAANYP